MAKSPRIPTKNMIYRTLIQRCLWHPQSCLPAQANCLFWHPVLSTHPAPGQDALNNPSPAFYFLPIWNVFVLAILSSSNFSDGWEKLKRKKMLFIWYGGGKKKALSLANRWHCKNAQNCFCSHRTCSHPQNFSNYQITTWAKSEPLSTYEGSDSDWNP